jgi:hypothetical protein
MATFVTAAVGFADAMIRNAIWMYILDFIEFIALRLCCGILTHTLALSRWRNVEF